MKDAQNAVKQFQEKFGHPVAKRLGLSDCDAAFRVRLIAEELAELADALAVRASFDVHCHGQYVVFETSNEIVPNVIDAADAIADLLYVILGTAVELGIDAEKVFNEVHRSNMTKSEPTEGNKKPHKGCDYSPPDIKGVLFPGSTVE